MDALGPRLERVSTVNGALARVVWRPCPLLVGARSRWARNTSRRRSTAVPVRGRVPRAARQGCTINNHSFANGY
eukprot:4699746-Prymnesium_polylepis.1